MTIIEQLPNTESMVEELNLFLKNWDRNYKNVCNDIPLFDQSLTKKWSNDQRKHFIKVFYHSRGHFKDFLWHLGNFAPDKQSKDMVLHNIEEEFNGSKCSHEQLYLNFAKKEGVNLSREFVENNYYAISMKKFNDIHMKWLYDHEKWISKLSAFSAYERLDSTDYEMLSGALFQKIEDEHEFFKIHREADHFDRTYVNLLEVWQKDKLLVKEAFDFIAVIQLGMWRDLSNEVFSFSKNH